METGPTSLTAFALSAVTSSASPPWWGVPVLAGIFTILGAALSQTTTLFLDRTKSRRDNATRWHADRLKAYSALLLALDKINFDLIASSTPHMEPEEVFDAVEPAATTARLVAGPHVDSAIWKTITGLAEIADRGWGDNRLQSMDEMQQRFTNLRNLMRAELGVPPSGGGPLPPGDHSVDASAMF
jgi:hypothetical protein